MEVDLPVMEGYGRGHEERNGFVSTPHEEVKGDHGARKRPLVRADPQSHRDDGSPVVGVEVDRTDAADHAGPAELQETRR